MIKNLSIRKFLYNILSKKRLQSKIKTTLNLDTSQQEQNNCYKIIGDNNKIIVIENGVEKDYTNKRINGLEIFINGNNNLIRIEMPNIFENNCNFRMDNTNNSIIDIKASDIFYKRSLIISVTFGQNQSVYIGQNTTIEGVCLIVGEPDTTITIGNDCMISAGIKIFSCDGHAIIDRETKEITNKPKTKVEIGNHCWIGLDTLILKDSRIPNNSIVAARSVVTKRFDEDNIAIGGNPATVIRKNIEWDRLSCRAYEEANHKHQKL